MSSQYRRLPTSLEGGEPMERFQIDDKGMYRVRRLGGRRLVLLGSFAVACVCMTAFASSSFWPPFPSHTSTVNQCSVFLVRNFESFTGFGSEYGIYLRAATLSARLGWTVVPDTKNWIYGELDDYFIAPNYTCRIPAGLLENQFSYQAFGTPGWENQTQLRLTRDFDQLLVMERLLRDTSIDTAKTAELALKQKLWSMDTERLTLPYGDSVPEGVITAFLDQAQALERLWVLNERMQAQVDRLIGRVGLEEHDVAKRRPVVVVQVRLGDKRTEQEDLVKVGTHMKFDDMSIYFNAVELAVARLYESDITLTPFPRAADGGSKPLVVVMTAELNVTEQLTALDVEHKYDFVISPSEEFTPEEQREYDSVILHKTAPSTSPVRRWEQKDFDAASRGLRVAMTRQLIAEMTVYSRHADAFIVSGNSNLGRLALILAGADGALGPPGRRALGGRVRSIDVPFYPTTWRHMIYAGA